MELEQGCHTTGPPGQPGGIGSLESILELLKGKNFGLRARIFKRLWSPGFDSMASIPPAYVAWRAGTITLFLLGA